MIKIKIRTLIGSGLVSLTLLVIALVFSAQPAMAGFTPPAGCTVVSPGVCTITTATCVDTYQQSPSDGMWYLTSSVCQDSFDPNAWNGGVTPLEGEELQSFLSIPNANGATACGVFDVNGHGFKTLLLSDFDGCASTGNYVVMCMDENGNWTDQEITDLHTSDDGSEIRFVSGQHGTCGLFSAPAGGAFNAPSILLAFLSIGGMFMTVMVFTFLRRA